MSTATQPHTCGKCGAPLSGYAPDGLCAACLLESAFENPASGLGDSLESQPLLAFKDYELLEEIARGGMGVVYRARQISLNRTVAIKMILGGHLANPAEVQRFRAEAETAAHLQHPNIVAIHEVGEHSGQPFFSMDLVEGRNLSQLVRDEPLPSRKAASYLKTIAEAVQYAHSCGVLHRDLKPSNILIDENDQPHVTDFGLAKRLDGDASLTITGQVLGSPSFIPPEQAAGRKDAIGPASDVYSLGANLYHLLTGRPPFVAETMTQTLRMVAENDPVSPRLLNAGVSRDLETICLKCLEKDPRRRYATAQEFVDELARFLRHEPIQARPANAVEKLWRWCRRKPALASAFALLFIVAIGSPIAVYRINQERKLAQRHAADSRERLLRQALANGNRLVDEKNYFSALPWFAEAADLSPSSSDKETIHILRIASVIREAPKLLHMWFHDKYANSAEFSKDGQYLVTASDDGTVCVWDVNTGEPLSPSQRHATSVNRASFSPDGSRVLSAGLDNARIWNARTGKGEVYLAHSNLMDGIFSPDGRLVATADSRGIVKLWESSTGHAFGPSLLHPKRPSSAEPRHLAFSPNGEKLLTACFGPEVCVWDVATGSLILSLTEIPHVRSAAFSPDGTRIATASWANVAHISDALTGKEMTPPLRHDRSVDHVGFSPDGKYVVSSCLGGTIRLWGARTGTWMRTFQDNYSVFGVEFSPNGQQLLTRNVGGWARVLGVETGKPVSPPLPHGDRLTCAQFHPDGRRIVTGCADGTVRLWDTQADGLLQPYLPQHSGSVLAVSMRGNQIVTMPYAGLLRLCDVGNRNARGEIYVSNALLGVQFNSRGNRLLTVERGPSTIDTETIELQFKTWDSASGGLLREAVVASPFSESVLHTFEMDANGERVAFGQNGELALLDLSAREVLWRLKTESATPRSLCFSPDARKLLFSSGSAVHVVDSATGKEPCAPLSNKQTTTSLEFSPDGRLILSASKDTSLRDSDARLWDAITGKLLATLNHKDGVLCAAFSPDGTKVATGAESETSRIFDVKTGRPLTRFMGRNIDSLAFSEDGRILATGNGEFAVQLWETVTGEPITPPLAHPGPIEAIFVLDKGNYLATRNDGVYRLWSLSLRPHSVDDWTACARLLADQRIDNTGVGSALEAHVLKELWLKCRKQLPEAFVFNTNFSTRQGENLSKHSGIPRPPMEPIRARVGPHPPNIPPRDPQAKSNLLDLTTHYNGSLTEGWFPPYATYTTAERSLTELPSGLQEFAGVQFDVRGVIQVGGNEFNAETGASWPAEAKGINANQKCRRLHFLHGAPNGSVLSSAVIVIGRYVIRYENGQQEVAPIILGENVLQWRFYPKFDRPIPRAVVAWTGENALTRLSEEMLRLYKFTWDNPRPETAIKTIDFESFNARIAPFLIAITAEP
jgi:WD40 repeat protein/predicted Ser/Thr protein kinase